MLFSLKTLIERQIHALGQALLSNPEPALVHAADLGNGRALSLGFGALQYGGERRNSLAGAVSFEELEFGKSPISSTPKIWGPTAAEQKNFEYFLQEFGLDNAANARFPESNPITLQRIDWSQEIHQSTLQDLSRASARQAKSEALSQNAKTNRLAQLIFLALRSGNISLAMLLFSHLEAATANELTQCLMEKVQKMQDNKRKLAQDIQNQKDDADGSKNLQRIKFQMEQVNDDISVLQTFIKDVAQNKQSALELANAFLSKEHETTMAIVRSFGR